MSLNESLVGADASAPKPSSTRRLLLLGSLLFVGAACAALALSPKFVGDESASAYDEVTHAPNADAPVRYLAAAEVAALVPGAVVSGANPLVRAAIARGRCALLLAIDPLCPSCPSPPLTRTRTLQVFIGLGDWGRCGSPTNNPVTRATRCNVQRRMVPAMEQWAAQLKAAPSGLAFVMSTGDKCVELSLPACAASKPSQAAARITLPLCFPPSFAVSMTARCLSRATASRSRCLPRPLTSRRPTRTPFGTSPSATFTTRPRCAPPSFTTFRATT